MFVLMGYATDNNSTRIDMFLGCYSTREKVREVRNRHYDEYSLSHQLEYRTIETELDQYQEKKKNL